MDKHLVDTKYLASIKMLTDLTYLPDLTIHGKTRIKPPADNRTQ